jgi:hypothetical protein
MSWEWWNNPEKRAATPPPPKHKPEVSGWISVHDALPEPGETVLAWRMRHPHTRTFAPCDYWRQAAHNAAWEGVIDEDTDMPGGVLVTA